MADKLEELRRQFAATPKQNQGTAVVESDGNGGDGLLIMFPDGAVAGAKNKRAAKKAINEWFEQNREPNSIGIGTIEWRL